MNTQPYLDYSIIKIEVTIKDNTTGEIFTGQTICNPRDAFDVSLGVTIAEKRAIRKMIDASLDDDISNLAC